MTNLFFIATGGAIGAVARYLISIFYKYYFPNFPIGTLFVNFVGSVLIGILAGQIDNYVKYLPFVKYFIIIGLLGSFTTFSSFSIESIQLFNDKKIFLSLIYVFLSVFLCISGAFLGYQINKL